MFHLSDQLGYVPPDTNLLDKRTDVIHIVLIIPERRRSGSYGFYNCKLASCVSGILSHDVVERLKAVHHPALGILYKPSCHADAGVHMCIYQSGEYGVMLEFDNFFRRIGCIKIIQADKAFYFTSVDQHGCIGDIANAFTGHCVEMRGLDDHVYFFHMPRPSFLIIKVMQISRVLEFKLRLICE